MNVTTGSECRLGAAHDHKHWLLGMQAYRIAVSEHRARPYPWDVIPPEEFHKWRDGWYCQCGHRADDD